MTRVEAWTRFAAEALGQVMQGTHVGNVQRSARARIAAEWADTMTTEWISRHGIGVPASVVVVDALPSETVARISEPPTKPGKRRT